MKAFIALASALAVAALPLGAAAQQAGAIRELRLDPVARVDAFHATRQQPGSADSLVAIGQLKASATLSQGTRALLETRLATTRRDGEAPGPAGDSRLLEAYVGHAWGDAEWRIGKQILAWGRADGVNPTDNLSPRDLVTWLPFEDDQRFGVWAARYSRRLGNALDLSLVFSPWFEGTLAPLPVLAHPVTTATPARNPANSTFAIKLNRSGAALDWSLSYLRGLSLLPGARMLGVDAQGPWLEFHHDRVHVLGADAARNFGRYGFRAEAAFTWPYASDDGSPAMRQPDLFGVAGIDRTLNENLNVNVQLFARHVLDFSSPYAVGDAVQRQVAVQNAITVGQQDRDSVGYSLRISDKWLGETLQGELLLVDNRTRNNRYLRPVFSYAVTDRVKASFGAVLYQGADDTLFGRRKPNNRLFLELRYAP